MKRLFAFLILILSTSIGLLEAQDLIDKRPQYSVTLNILGDATYNVKKMKMKIMNNNEVMANCFNSLYAYNLSGKLIMGHITEKVAQEVIPNLWAMYSSTFIPIVGWVYSIGDVVLTIASSGHEQSREYIVYSPVSGYYSFDTWIPGDWDQPCSMIKIYSIDANGNQLLKFSEEYVAVSDRVIHRQVYLPRGLNRINVAVGSGSVKFHTAGSLQQFFLDSPTYLQWTNVNELVSASSVGLLPYLPEVGTSCQLTYDVVLPPTPADILDGSISYSNLHPGEAILPVNAVSTSRRINFYGEPTPEELAQIGEWDYLHMKAMASAPSSTPTGGRWTLTRQADYMTTYMCKAIYHPYEVAQ